MSKPKQIIKCPKCGGPMTLSKFNLCQQCINRSIKEFKQAAPPLCTMVNDETRLQLHKIFGKDRAEQMMSMAQMSSQNWFRLNVTRVKEIVSEEDRVTAAIAAWFLGYIQCAVDIECTHNRPNSPASNN